MTMVPALAQAHADHIERMKRLGSFGPSRILRVHVEARDPEPALTPPPVEIPAIPNDRDWLSVATPNLNPISTKAVMAVVAAAYDVSQMEIVSRRRTAEIFMPRAVVCWILRNHSVLSLPQIGMRVGGRDHTTVRSAIIRVDDVRRRDTVFAERVDELAAIARSKDDRWRAAA